MKNTLRIVLSGYTRALFGVRIPVNFTLDVPEGRAVPVSWRAIKFEGVVMVSEKAAAKDGGGSPSPL